MFAVALFLNFFQAPISAQQFQTNSNSNLSTNLSSVYLGGSANLISSNANQSLLAGGLSNTISAGAWRSFLGGGVNNTISNSSRNAVIAGGQLNTVSGNWAAILGGADNSAQGAYAVVGGGRGNKALGGRAGIFSGESNSVSGNFSTVVSGKLNSVTGTYSVILGGYGNSASGWYGTVLGGAGSKADQNFAFAAGNRALATNAGAFVWGDSQNADFASTGTNQFLIRASGGVGINTNNPGTNSLFVRGPTSIDGNLTVSGTINGTFSNATFTTLTVNTLTSSNGAITLQPGGNTGFSVSPSSTVALTFTNPFDPTSTATYTGTAHNVVGGFSGNLVAPGLVGGTIAGGGRLVISSSEGVLTTNINRVLNHFGTIGGGSGNTAAGFFATIAGGEGNEATGYASTIGGGLNNSIRTPDLNPEALYISTIGGGEMNKIWNAPGGTIGGGYENTITNTNVFTVDNVFAPSVIAGGIYNVASNSPSATIGGGDGNSTDNAYGAVVAGGLYNRTAASDTTTVSQPTIGGGYSNTATGDYATVPGGADNQASGTGSFAAGVRAKAVHDYSFVWGGSPDVDTVSTTSGEFAVRSPGGAKFITSDSGSDAGVVLPANGTGWSSLSDSNAKTGITAIDHRETLRKVAALPVTAWNYKHDPKRRYIGPMAQDFHATFGLGHDDKHISTLDTDGVTLSAIKGLVEEIREQDAVLTVRGEQIRALEKQIARFKTEVGL